MSNTTGALREYRSVGTAGSVAAADPHQLILMLMSAALDSIAAARGHIAGGAVEPKGSSISRAISIIEGLRVSLDPSASTALTDNLDELYRYMTRRLLQANLTNDVAMLEEVAGLLHEIRSAWSAIPPHLRRISSEAELVEVAGAAE